MAVAVAFILRVQRRIHDAANRGLGLHVGAGDLDLLETDDVRPLPSLEMCPERGSRGRGFRASVRAGGRLEEIGDGRGGGREKGADAVDVPGVDVESVHGGRGW